MSSPITERDLAELALVNGNTLAFELHSARIADDGSTSYETEQLDEIADELTALVADGKLSKATRALADKIAAIIGLELAK